MLSLKIEIAKSDPQLFVDRQQFELSQNYIQVYSQKKNTIQQQGTLFVPQFWTNLQMEMHCSLLLPVMMLTHM